MRVFEVEENIKGLEAGDRTGHIWGTACRHSCLEFRFGGGMEQMGLAR